MLHQIWAFDPSLVLGTEPARLPIGHDHRIEDPWLEYARLRSHGPDFLRALSVIARHPLRELKAKRTQLPLQYVRRADRQTALAALRNAELLTVLAHRDSSAKPMTAWPPFDVPVSRETLDSAGNRCIAGIAYAVSRRAVRLRKTLQSAVEGEHESDTRTAHPPLAAAAGLPGQGRAAVAPVATRFATGRCHPSRDLGCGPERCFRGSGVLQRLRFGLADTAAWRRGPAECGTPMDFSNVGDL